MAGARLQHIMKTTIKLHKIKNIFVIYKMYCFFLDKLSNIDMGNDCTVTILNK